MTTFRPVLFPCKADKSPATPHGFHDASDDPDVQRELWQNHWGPLRGLVLGEASGVAQLDVDIRPGIDGLATLAALNIDLPPTLTASTPSGGRHYFFAHIPNVRIARLGPGLDWRATGHYACIPPGPGREWIDRTDPAEPPRELIELVLAARTLTLPVPSYAPGGTGSGQAIDQSRVQRYAQRALYNACNDLINQRKPGRGHMLYVKAMKLGRLISRGWIDRVQVEQRLEFCANHIGLVRDYGLRTVRSTIRSGIKTGLMYPYPDLPEFKPRVQSDERLVLNTSRAPS